jgi:hypothetical protein
MNFKEIAEAYEKACAAVSEAIRTSRYKAEYWMQQLGFSASPSAYYRRLKAGNWEPEHLAIIGQLLDQK